MRWHRPSPSHESVLDSKVSVRVSQVNGIYSLFQCPISVLCNDILVNHIQVSFNHIYKYKPDEPRRASD